MATGPIESEAQFEARVLQAEKGILVHFYADWCYPCAVIGGQLAELADADKCGDRIVGLNVDDLPQIAERYEVRAVPTLIWFSDGKPLATHRGKAELKQIRKLMAK